MAAVELDGRVFLRRALSEALEQYGTPEIFNTDQGRQFTSTEFVGVLENAGVRVSMDGRGRWIDNVMVERLWRSLKYENGYLNAYETGTEARKGIGAWIDFYNARRPHSSLDDHTPMKHTAVSPDLLYCRTGTPRRHEANPGSTP